MGLLKLKSGKYRVDVSLKSGNGRMRITAYTNKRASLKLQENIEQLDACITAGERPDRELSSWLEQLPETMKKKLVAHNLLSKSSLERSKTITEHLNDFIKYKKSQVALGAIKEKQVGVLTSRLNRVIKECSIKYLTDMKVTTIERWISETLSNNKLAPKTINHHSAGMKQFSNWLFRNNKISDNILISLKKININSGNVTFTRRSLTDEEVSRLINTTKVSEATHNGVKGCERALAYQISLFSGLRYNEVVTLERGDIDLENQTIRCRDINSKNGQTTTLPLQDELAAELQKYFTENPRLPKARVFPKMPDKGIDLLKRDLIASHINYDTPEGRADYHSLRHTFCTRLAKSGVTPQLAQKMMRHSSIELTTNFYTHYLIGDQREAVAKLPKIVPNMTEDIATGTDNTCVSSEISAVTAQKKDARFLPNQANSEVFCTDSYGQKNLKSEATANSKYTVNNSANPIKQGVNGISNTVDSLDTYWRSERDSNPRWREPHWFSKPAH